MRFGASPQHGFRSVPERKDRTGRAHRRTVQAVLLRRATGEAAREHADLPDRAGWYAQKYLIPRTGTGTLSWSFDSVQHSGGYAF